ncbi:MAG: putative selenium-dependent hydroxylase accessory protein YqeC, partial [Actinomyces sp.]
MVAVIELADLVTVLRPGPHELVALVGGGGKTTLLFALGDQLGGSVILTTTTKMGRERTGGHPVLFSPPDERLLADLDRSRVVVAWGADGGHKAVGVDPTVCDHWFDLADHVVVEADGSRRRPFKAPRPFEPVIPSRTTLVVACLGADAIGRVIADRCQRPLRVAAAAGCSPYDRLTPARLAAVL